MKSVRCLLALAGLAGLASPALALERLDAPLKVFQFPADQIPRIDGNADDWAMVPDSYAIGTDQLRADNNADRHPDPQSLKGTVKVGWVKGLNRLYFLYQAYDNYWDFGVPSLHNDTFELIVDGDASGGPLIAEDRVGSEISKILPRWDAWFAFQGTQAQNYHIFTPHENKDWCMAWSAGQWVKELPYANHAQSYNFRPGEAGNYTLEFWITPFDYAGAEGPPRAVESKLFENKIIGLAWVVIDYDNASSTSNNGFWNLTGNHTVYGNASQLVAFKLMPLEPQFVKKLDARWSFKIVDMDRRLVAFKDESVGNFTSWKWDFGDQTTSTEQNPIHAFKNPGNYVVTLYVDGPDGPSHFTRVWDVTLK